ncbi:hypothetical protein B0H13DRAFT_1930616 [Mycena leptocephala]|nr:hypothetical protein B0H13DRAFT_1930616 [Mycena leptocephala]
MDDEEEEVEGDSLPLNIGSQARKSPFPTGPLCPLTLFPFKSPHRLFLPPPTSTITTIPDVAAPTTSMVSVLTSAPSAASPQSDTSTSLPIRCHEHDGDRAMPDTTTAMRSVICPPKAPEWFESTFLQVCTSTNGKYALPSKGRPAEVSRWIGGNRTKLPEVRNVTAYAGAWCKRCDSMQPEWRVCGADGK